MRQGIVWVGLSLAFTGCGRLSPDPGVERPGFAAVQALDGARWSQGITMQTTPLEVAVEPADVLPLESVRCTVPDATGAAAVKVAWFVDGVAYDGPTRTHELAGDTLPPNVVQGGESWVCAVSVWDEAGRSAGRHAFTPAATIGGNVLLIVVDDLGVDNVGFWFADDPPEGHEPPPTPNIDMLAEQGVTFRNAYSTVKCSPSRASLLTGRHGRRTGATSLMGTKNWYEVPTNEVTVAELAQREGYDTSAVGKWHLSSMVSDHNAGHALESGFNWHAGSLGNLNVTNPGDYFNWRKLVNGDVTMVSETYATTDTTDDAIDRIEAMPEPWFTWVAYNAPHYPWHVPPGDLTGLEEDPTTPETMYDAAVMAVDTEIGRLLESIEPEVRDRTTVVFVSDNGSSRPVISAPFDDDEGKFTPYEGGVHVPMVVTGPSVTEPGAETEALVHLVDFLPTVAAITGAPLRDLAFDETGEPVALDGQSWLRQLEDPASEGDRETIYGEMLEPNGGEPYFTEVTFAVDRDHKLIVWDRGDELFDMHQSSTDEGERLELDALDATDADAYAHLADTIDSIVAEMHYDGPERPENPSEVRR